MGKRERLYRWVREHPVIIDTVFIVAPLWLVSIPFAFAQTGDDGVPIPIAVALVNAMTLPLAIRRPHPVISGGIIAGAALLYGALGITPTLCIVAIPASVYALAAYAPRWASRGGLAFSLFGSLLFGVRYTTTELFRRGDVLTQLGLTAFTTVLCASLVLVAWTLGDLNRVRRQQLSDLAERNRLLEIERAQEARLGASAERARIAREMHDVVAHSLSVVIAQADGGRYAAAGDPEAATRALATIAGTGRTALADMRRLLGVLRDGSGGNEVRPQPRIADLPELIESVRAVGLPLEFRMQGAVVPMQPGPELAVYRIVQEGLTNTMKHGGPRASASVRLEYLADGVSVRVDDTGRGSGADSGDGRGHGIQGMAERVHLYSGTFDARPTPGGFAVTAFLPYTTGAD